MYSALRLFLVTIQRQKLSKTRLTLYKNQMDVPKRKNIKSKRAMIKQRMFCHCPFFYSLHAEGKFQSSGRKSSTFAKKAKKERKIADCIWKRRNGIFNSESEQYKFRSGLIFTGGWVRRGACESRVM